MEIQSLGSQQNQSPPQRIGDQDGRTSSSQCTSLRLMKTITYPKNTQIPVLFNPHQHHPILTKVKAYKDNFLSSYSDGRIFQYSFNQCSIINYDENFRLEAIYCPYHSAAVIDFEMLKDGNILACTHTEATLYDVNKQKSINLRGHEQTVVAVSGHPTNSAVAVSVSNLIIHHDLRMPQPINVNFITPPVFDIQYFKNGQFYMISGEPCRIGGLRNQRTLKNGYGSFSENGKFVLLNGMDSQISLWNWQTSVKVSSTKGVKNTINYQPIHYKMREGKNAGFLFLQDDGKLLDFDFQTKQMKRCSLFDSCLKVHQHQSSIKYIQGHDQNCVQKCGSIESSQIEKQNWKMEVQKNINTSKILLYQHQSACIKCFQL